MSADAGNGNRGFVGAGYPVGSAVGYQLALALAALHQRQVFEGEVDAELVVRAVGEAGRDGDAVGVGRFGGHVAVLHGREVVVGAQAHGQLLAHLVLAAEAQRQGVAVVALRGRGRGVVHHVIKLKRQVLVLAPLHEVGVEAQRQLLVGRHANTGADGGGQRNRGFKLSSLEAGGKRGRDARKRDVAVAHAGVNLGAVAGPEAELVGGLEVDAGVEAELGVGPAVQLNHARGAR